MVSTWMPTAVLALALCPALAAQSPAPFSPARIERADVPASLPPTVVGGGEVLVEIIIDRAGAVTRPVLIRSTPPYGQMMLEAIARWRFQPARAMGPDGVEAAVEVPVVVAALFRPPTLFDGPTLGEPPRDLAVASGDAASPTSVVVPAYPPLAANAVTISTVLFEVSLDEGGGIRDARTIATDPAFEGAARDALMQWTFRGARFRGRAVPATAYVVFGFRPPVVSSVR